MRRKKISFLFVGLVLIAILLRFYNLMWGNGNFFNPDERNMANAVSQMRLPDRLPDVATCIIKEFTTWHSRNDPEVRNLTCNLNPHFYAYGQLPLYMAYASHHLTTRLNPFTRPLSSMLEPNYVQIMFWLRFWSAVSSVGIVMLMFILGKNSVEELYPRQKKVAPWFGLAAMTLTAFTPGLIQAAHFGTTESILTFFFMCITTITQKMYKVISPAGILAASIILGLAIGTKLSAILFATPMCIMIIVYAYKNFLQKGWKQKIRSNFKLLLLILCAVNMVVFFILVASPFNLLDAQNFFGSMNYEVPVVRGTMKVFYTRQYEQTIPLVFQFVKIFPFTFGFLATTLTTIMVVVAPLWYGKRILNKKPALVLVSLWLTFVAYTIPNAIMYAKWARFMTPALPLMIMFIVLLLPALYAYALRAVKNKFAASGLLSLLILLLIIPGIQYMAVYRSEDVRITASRWIINNIPSNTHVLSETANVIDIPLMPEDMVKSGKINAYNLNPVSFDFYHLEENPELPDRLVQELAESDYIIMPSRRLYANILRIPQQFPIQAAYYQSLLSGKLGFEMVAAFTSFPAFIPDNHPPLSPSQVVSNRTGLQGTIQVLQTNLTRGYVPDEGAEETWTVFDHPVIRIYKKIKPLSITEYRSLLNI